jgi:organic hydroperoxide reductase OsmC/OhrA
MIQYPIPFETRILTSSGTTTAWQACSSSLEIDCAIPPEFEGPGGGFSPEDLFAQALTNCFVATFKLMAEKSRLNYEKLEAHGKLSVDLDESKRPCMKDFMLNIRISSPSDADRATRLVKKAMESGFILNSVKTNISYELLMD